ncbi:MULTISPECIES: prolyl oligopeptidase family protein [unclassified Arthrobacter]|uniref:prolyl oligopeptidase family serine peptidase n=1 Tax=unclassified Arthrobacter TaxID=235627 RepID=UPI00159E0699|nr:MULTISPECIES: prolyl oligopeptidase family serine peptidase [unclassified Arthrobacter]MCQ9165017.1 prolyl oligopeptidase family serine peptidase [Arthrobacter sp. STN4]NVM98919.1 S9 family peptidase [Arthrobacter sp. SDTb3-6]
MTLPLSPDATTGPAVAEQPFDENLWLEDIHGSDAMAWVREHNARTDAALVNPAYTALEAAVLEVLDSKDRIAMVSKHGDWYYNFWRDEANPRGLWRRTDWDSYVSGSPAWQLILDVDALAAAEGTEWLWAGASLLRPPAGEEYRLAMVALSPDGGDAVTYREFDLAARAFVPGGFELPTAKTRLSWVDADTLYVGTDTGTGSMTASSYPAASRVLHRGESLAELAAKQPLFSVPPDHLSGGVSHDSTPGFERDVAYDVLDFFRSRSYLRTGDDWVHLDVPDDMNVSLHKEWLLLRPRTDWAVAGSVHAAGALLAIELDAFLAGGRDVRTVFAPTPAQSLQSWSWTRDYLLLNLLEDVSSKILVLDPAREWAASGLDACPPLHSVDAYAVDDEDPAAGNDYWLVATGFLTPSTVYRGQLPTGGPAAVVRQAPSFFNEAGYAVEQHFAVSRDGTRIPYFQVGPKDLVLDGGNPTLLGGYGGFEVSRTPSYSGAVGRSWLERRAVVDGVERGGVYVVANIRGGGEYGPGWHTAALQENRHRAYEDFAAVARDLAARGVARPKHLGCAGGSNGGLLVGNMLTHYPELFGAISCGVPLLDMRRYTKLSAGASWIAEYGDPDVPAQWEFIKTFSPYHLLQAGLAYPPLFIWTATSDDRVGPVQARKMAARMESLGLPVWFHEALEGGHAGAGNNAQAARLHTASHEFLWRALTGGF